MKPIYLVGALLLPLVVCVATAQVATGVPPFASFGGGPFDVVNLGNLNVHFAIPVLNKTGRGTNFYYFLSYDSSVWYPVTSSGVTSWTFLSNWGWTANSPAIGGSIATKLVPNWPCIGPPLTHVTATVISTFVDPTGTAHPMHTAEDPCSTGSVLQSTSTDGSGWTLYYQSSHVWATSRAGANVVPVISGSGGSYTDPNGNQITLNGSGQYFDTLSNTTPVLTQAGSGTPSSPSTFTYTAPGGGASYTVNYTQYTVATNFGISGITEYGPLSKALISSISLPDLTSYAFTYEQTPGPCSPLPGTYANCITGRIASVSLPTGGSISYAYTGGSNGIESDGSTAGLTRTLSPGSGWQYARTQVSGSHWQTTVTSPPDPVNAGSASDVTTVDFEQDSNTSTPSYNFYETQRVVNQGSSTVLTTLTNCYNGNYASCTTTPVTSPITQVDAYSQLPNASARLSEVSYNGYGLVTGDSEYGYGITLGAAPSITSRLKGTGISYASLGNSIVDRPATITVSGYVGSTWTTLASTTYTYDQGTPTSTSGTPQHIAITGSRGNATTISSTTSGTASLSATITYYDTGNPHVVTDVNGAQTTYVYGSTPCTNSLPTTINEPLSLSRSIAWNCGGGVVTQVTDENGNNVKENFTDPDFWRPANILDQLSNQTNFTYSGQTAVETALQNLNGGNSAYDFRTTADGFSRPILSQRLQSPGSTNYDTTETDYDNMGRSARTTMPFVVVAGGMNGTAPGLTTTYDALGRPLTLQDANGGMVSYQYLNNDVLQITSGSQTLTKQLEYDGLGRLTSVCEVTSTSGSGSCGQSNSKTGFLTLYTYDAFGNLLTVTQNAQPGATGTTQSRVYTYDRLSRPTSETNPETNNLAYAYTYDSDSTCGTSKGDQVKRVDALGNVSCYAYDQLHRLTATTYPSGTYSAVTPTKCYVYDAATVNSVAMANGRGRLAEAYTGTGTSCPISSKTTDVGISYSARGEVTDVYESTSHSSGYYHVTASYWPHGLLNQLSSNISGLPTISYGGSGGTSGLDGEGRMLQVTSSSGQNPVTGVTYTNSGTTEPIGSLTNVTLGSVDADSFQYDTNTGRPTQYQFKIGTTQSVTSNLGWNSNGTLSSLNITDQLNSANSQNCAYTYDDLSRVASANCGSTIWSQNFGYDAFGNIVKSVPTGSTGNAFQASYSNSTNWISSVGSLNPTYDNNGNLKYDTFHNFTWDAEGNMLTVDSTGVQITYDAFNRAVEQNRGGSYTQIVYAAYGGKLALMNGTTLTRAFVPLPGGPTAVYASGTTGPIYYRHPDWLGSSRFASTQSRTKYFDVSYAPFGENYNDSGTTDHNFTGQNQDTNTGYYDFLFREYSQVQGRWMSPDPAGTGAVDPTNPQTWNRYAYVGNTPLTLVDPMGLDGEPCGHLVLIEHVGWVCAEGGVSGGGSGGGGGYAVPTYGWITQPGENGEPDGSVWGIVGYTWVSTGVGPPVGPGPVDTGGGGGGGASTAEAAKETLKA